MNKRIDKKLNPYYILLVVLLLGISSCQEPIDLNLPEEKKLVVLSNFSQDETIIVRLGTTSNLTGNNTKYPANADLKLFKDGAILEHLKYQPNTGLGLPFYSSTHIPIIGDRYSISCSYEDYPEINASDVIPTEVEIENIELTSKEIFENNTSNFIYDINVEIELSEMVSDENYFHLKIIDDLNFFYLDNMDTVRQTIFSDDILFSLSDEDIDHISLLHEPGILLDRNALDDPDKIQLNFTIYNLPNPFVKGNFPLQVRNVSSNYYKFHKSVGEQEITSADVNIFSIPSTIIYNNVENGIGNFTGYSSSIAKVKI